ncbi:MAG: hypothetical protein AAFQ98_04820 [Bacteroidota bacterium]
MKHLKSLRPLGAVLFGLLAGCQPGQSDTQTEKIYFDITGFLNTQVEELSSTSPQLNKSTQLGEDSDQFSSTPMKADWDQEFRFFFELDINQPILLDQYTTSEETEMAGEVTRYSLKEESGNGVQWLEVVEKEGTVSQISAFTIDKNALYATQRQLSMNFDAVGGKPQMTDYSVRGFQKMVLKDTVNYSIQGTVLYP